MILTNLDTYTQPISPVKHMYRCATNYISTSFIIVFSLPGHPLGHWTSDFLSVDILGLQLGGEGLVLPWPDLGRVQQLLDVVDLDGLLVDRLLE